MKKLRELQGGYPRQQDYLLMLQNELSAIADGLFAKLGVDMVLKGCEVVNNNNGTVNIAAGIVFVDGEVVRFDGANNVPTDGTKTLVKATAVTTDPKVFADGITKNVYTEIKAVVGTKTSVAQIAIKPAELYNLASYIQDVVASYAQKGEIKMIYDFDNSFLSNFDASGLGVTARYTNWALVNGNNGTPDAKGRTFVNVGTFTDPTTGVQTEFTHGQVGGEVVHKLTINEMPSHSHGYTSYSDAPNLTGDNDNKQGFVGAQTDLAGGDLPHNNMQPYIAVYAIMKVV